MFYAYVAQSVNFKVLYKGHYQNLEERIKQHNSGRTESIRPYLPFKIIYFEEFETRAEAIKREKYFKGIQQRGTGHIDQNSIRNSHLIK
jgi:putative endonuclease